MRENKRGLSNIVATVLIILLAIAAVAIVWSFIAPTIRNTAGEVDLSQACFNTEIKPLNCAVTGDVATVQFARGDVTKVKEIVLILEKAGGTTQVSRVDLSTNPVDLLETVTDDAGSTDFTGIVGGASPDRLKAAAVVMDPDNPERTRTCEVSLESVACE